MVFLANLGVDLHVCLCGDLQVASAQTLDFLDIGQKSSFPDWKPVSPGKSFPDGNQLDSMDMDQRCPIPQHWNRAPEGCEETGTHPAAVGLSTRRE
ncbi:hypothetical protein TRIP_B200730 [uncultured Desulfatiglans sp.]|uniref:Uncharacterized protein n=1 Tax=Uncultured Desulfatiglans sp. TaxID=1748965 RepID=A0A653A3I0_UNCDX|nr:hypothetical protein TRIP_B200730 [uncultured Desulfatiglans sp.]